MNNVWRGKGGTDGTKPLELGEENLRHSAIYFSLLLLLGEDSSGSRHSSDMGTVSSSYLFLKKTTFIFGFYENCWIELSDF